MTIKVAVLVRCLHYFLAKGRDNMQLLSGVRSETGALDMAEEQRASFQNEAKWFVVWAGIWIAALALLLPALI